jgi:sigma-B regulation protein RsbU (phosphoserine phosphatase)
MTIRTKLMAAFLSLSVISLALFGYIALVDIRKVGQYALESGASLGESAIRDSTRALEELGEEIIQQRATDVALQCRIFLDAHPGTSMRALQRNDEFRRIVVQSVGNTGYTILFEKGTGIMLFHPNPELVNFDMHGWKDKLPEFWQIFEQTLDGSSGEGYYDWQDPDGQIRQKYMYIVPVSEKPYMIAATTYIDEFSIPIKEIEKEIGAATVEIGKNVNESIDDVRDAFLNALIAMMLAVASIAFLLARMITRPILALTRGAKAIGSGEMDVQVDVRTGDELQDLAASFNRMVLDLKKHMRELERATAEKEGLLKELEIARDIQQRLLPESAPEIEGIDIAAANIPAREVGGDYFDFIPIAKGIWGLAIADVSGKGMPAAMFMGLSRTIIRASATGNYSADAAIRQANDLICRDSTSGMFVTLFYAVLDSAERSLRYVNAGHNPPVLYRPDEDKVQFLKAKGIALGVRENISLEESRIDLSPGDLVVLYTDGVTDAVNDRNEEFGLERLLGIIRSGRDLSAEHLLERILREVSNFTGGQPSFDDLTLMVLKVQQ